MVGLPHNKGAVIPDFARCLARPVADGARPRALLETHLAETAARCGRTDGDGSDVLGFLAGLFHDFLKAQAEWQVYVRSSCKGAPPPHGPPGAAVFFAVVRRLRDEESGPLSTVSEAEILQWTRAIAGHHGELRDLDPEAPPPWAAEGDWHNRLEAALATTDLEGFCRFLRRQMPGIGWKRLEPGTLLRDSAAAAEPVAWSRIVRRFRRRLLPPAVRHQPLAVADAAGQFPRIASRLVAADRMHAGDIRPVAYAPRQAEEALKCLQEYCIGAAEKSRTDGAAEILVRRRGALQEQAVDRARQDIASGARFLSLVMPTGYGKTLTSLRVALDVCRSGAAERIIYVAPYISILSQAAANLRNATGCGDLLEHHHLSLIANETRAPSADRTSLEKLWNACDSWQAPIVAATFNQFFTALFPATAQQTFRTHALKNAFIIVDEPQIIAPENWNLFLRRLRVAGDRDNLHVLFTTATQPMLEGGLLTPAASLVKAPPPMPRYDIHAEEAPLDAEQIAHRALERRRQGPVAVVLNTVRDAIAVFREIHAAGKACGETEKLYFLCGAMLPGHKADVIRTVRDALQNTTTPPPMVVCTQVLEAGVDLSFRSIFRARSILPSIIQTAGRANRHGERERAVVFVFDFARADGRDSRAAVYRNRTARELTDALLPAGSTIPEEDTAATLDRYFRQYAERKPDMEMLQLFAEAARGRAGALAGIDPFGGSLPAARVLVPFHSTEREGNEVAVIFRRFGLRTPADLPEKLQKPRELRRLSFLERKLFGALVNRFTVSVRREIAVQCASPLFPSQTTADAELFTLDSREKYSPNTGLAEWYVRAAASGMEVDGCEII